MANGQGVNLFDASRSKFYHSNFVNNTVQVNHGFGSNCAWDDGYPSGGNYWSDYWGADEKSGPYQNETGSDGISDEPYNAGDRHPLMSFYRVTPVYPTAVFSYSPGDPIAKHAPKVFNASGSVCQNGTITAPTKLKSI